MGIILVVAWLFCAFVSAAIAGGKGRSSFGWFFLGLIIGPFALAVALLPDLKKQQEQEANERELKKCPFCAESIKREAVKCRFCGADLPIIKEPACPHCHKTDHYLTDQNQHYCPNCDKYISPLD